MKQTQTVDEYISGYPEEVQDILQKIRNTIRGVLPDATEKMSYGIPTYWQDSNLVHFGAYEHHIGFYPGSQAIQAFQAKLKRYDTSKGTIRFPLDKPIPYDLIEEITRYQLDTSR